MPAARFRPPRVELSLERRWALLRAFGPVDLPCGPLRGAEAARVALAFDVQARVGARVSLQRLADELGRHAALGLFHAHARSAQRARRLLALARGLATHADGVPLAFLKGAALLLSDVAQPESRPLGDVDVLVPTSRAEDFAASLRARGFRRADVPERPHQLAPLVDETGRVVEIHRHVPGLRVGAGGPATFEALISAGAWRRVADLPGDVCVPVPAVLAAHAVAHGLVQSGRAPHAYSLTRLLGDVLDLGLERDDDLARRAFLWLDGVDAPEWEALRGLARALGCGDLSVFDDAQADAPHGEGLLLRHVVAGALDLDYRRALRAEGALAGKGLWARLAAVGAALRLSDAQVDALYGRPHGRWGYAWRRLMRPFDLGRRFLRARAAARRIRAS